MIRLGFPFLHCRCQDPQPVQHASVYLLMISHRQFSPWHEVSSHTHSSSPLSPCLSFWMILPLSLDRGHDGNHSRHDARASLHGCFSCFLLLHFHRVEHCRHRCRFRYHHLRRSLKMMTLKRTRQRGVEHGRCNRLEIPRYGH